MKRPRVLSDDEAREALFHGVPPAEKLLTASTTGPHTPIPAEVLNLSTADAYRALEGLVARRARHRRMLDDRQDTRSKWLVWADELLAAGVTSLAERARVIHGRLSRDHDQPTEHAVYEYLRRRRK